MKRLLIFASLLIPALVQAQTTTVTGTITDAQGNAYANGTASAIKVVATGLSPGTPTTVPTSATGFFTFSGSTNALPSPASYQFTVCATPVLLGQPTVNPTPRQICFTSGPIAISGASQDISTTLNAIAPTLGPQGQGTNPTFINPTVTGTLTVPTPSNCANSVATGLNTTLGANCTNSTGTGTWTVGGAANLSGGGTLAGTYTGNPTLSGNLIANGASQTLTNPNSTVVCDGTKYATIQAAAAALPATGGEVVVPSASTCTWNGVGMTGSVTVRFLSAVATYSLGSGNAITMTGGNNHLICQAGQPNGLSNQNLPSGSGPSGVILNFTGLTGTQDAILITGNNNNDGNTVEGCYIRMNSTGRAGVHICGNGNKVLNNIFHLAGVNGVWVEGCSAAGAHSFENRIQGNDVIHAGGDGYLVSVDPAGTGVGDDVDGLILDHNDYHPRDTTGGTSTGQGCHLLVPSTANLSLQTIHHIFFTKFLSNGSAQGTYACKLEMNVAAATVAGISDIMWTNGELEDVYQANTGTALLVSTTTPRGVQHIWYRGGIGDGFAAAHNLTGASLNALGFYLESGSADVFSNTSNPNLFDTVSFVNNFSATPSCSGATGSPGLRFGTTQPVTSLVYTNDNVLHYFRCDTGVDQVKFDIGNTRILPATDNTWKLGDHNVSRFTEIASASLYMVGVAAPSASANHAVFYFDSGTQVEKVNFNNTSFFQVAQVITATSTAFATATTAGTCVQNTTAVAGAATTMAVSVSPVSTPGVGAVWSAFVSSAGNVTINECAVAASAGGTIAFNIRVTP